MLKQKLIDAELYYPGPHDAKAMQQIRELAAECELYVVFAIHGPRGNPDNVGYLRSVGDLPDRGHQDAAQYFTQTDG